MQEADSHEERKFLPGIETGRGILTLTIDPVRAISVPLYVGSAFFSAVIDTGASVSVMDNKCILQQSILEAYSGPTLLTATGAELCAVGMLTAMIQLGSWKQSASFVVVRDCPVPVLLGLDFLSSAGIVIDTRGRAIILPDNEVIRSYESFGTTPVFVKKTARIAGRTAAYVAVSGVEGPSMFDPTPGLEDAKGCIIARDFANKRAYVHIVNLAGAPLTLQAGSCIGSATPARVVDADRRPSDKHEGHDEWNAVISANGRPSNLTREQQDRLIEVLNEFKDIFASSNKPFGRVHDTVHGIDTGDAKPISQGLRPSGPAAREVARQEVEDMLEKGVIQPCRSPWASPIVLVKKKDGSTRFCVDFRKVNDVTVKDVHPLPRISDMLEALGSGRYFSTLDAAAGYWQIPLREEDKGKSAFICSEGLYEFNVMPFGLCNAPATYQRLMNLLLAGLTWRSCLVYLDDILIFSPTFERHVEDVREVFQRIRTSGMLLKPSKCFFGLTTVQYLGHIVTPEGIRPDPAKVIRIRNFPAPRNVSEVRTFLGMAGYYRKFVRNFSIVAAPISSLTAKDQPFIWTEECAKAFDVLRNAIADDAVLNHPEFDKPFIIDSDASGVGLGAVLSQVVEGG